MVKVSEQTFFKRRHIYSQQTHELVNITNHQGKKMHIKITRIYHSHLSEWLLSERQWIAHIGKDGGKKGPLCTGAGNHYGEQYGVSSKAEIGNRTTIQPRKFTSVFFPKKNPQKQPKTLIQKDTWVLMFTAVLFIVSKIWKPPKRPSTGNG